MSRRAALFVIAVLLGWTVSVSMNAAQSTNADADALLAAEDWDGAAAAYGALTRSEPGDGDAWWGLGQALHRLERYDRAVEALEKALGLGFREKRMMFEIARSLAAGGSSAAAVEWLDRMADAGSTARLAVLNAPEFERLRPDEDFQRAVDALRPCRSPQYREFDFWLGEWDVVSAVSSKQQPPARNRISSIQDGCVILEEYETPRGYSGVSLSFYESGSGRWHQAWMDNQGQPIRQSGGFRDGKMILLDDPEEGRPLNRTTWTPLEDGRVRQHWESSTDGGTTWSTVFDGMYTRSK